MFSDEELEDYGKQLNKIGITEETRQKEVLEYFYKVGKIIYEFIIKNYGKEN